MSYVGLNYPDGAILYTGIVTSVGAGSTLDTTGYVQTVWQVTGSSFSGIITAESSLDGVYWTPIFITELSSLGQKTQIETVGTYLVKADARYVRYNTQNISGTVNLLILGNNYIASNPVDRLSLAMDETNNIPLNIKLQLGNSGIKQDNLGAFVLSDAPAPITVTQPATGGTTIIDTTGYQSLHVTTNATFASTVGFQASNDGINFSATGIVVTTATGVATASISAATTYIVPCYARYLKIVATTAGSFTYYFRNTAQTTNQNLSAIGGTAISSGTAQLGVNMVQIGASTPVTAGLAGTLGVGGAAAVGSAPTTNPLLAGVVDSAGVIRRATSDPLGGLIVANRVLPSSNASIIGTTTGNTPIGMGSFVNQLPINVQDTTQFESQSQIELLGLILQELKILNQQIYEIPRVLAIAIQGPTVAQQGITVTLGDEPTQMRNDASLFINQQ
jgi:hypothetical protein